MCSLGRFVDVQEVVGLQRFVFVKLLQQTHHVDSAQASMLIGTITCADREWIASRFFPKSEV